MSTTAILAVKVTADGKAARADLQQTTAAVDKFGDHVGGLNLTPATKDAANYAKSIQNVGREQVDAAKKATELGDKFSSTGSKSAQVAGAFGDLGGALSQAGGPLGLIGSGMEKLAPFIMAVTGAADLAEVATGAMSVKQGLAAGTAQAQAAATVEATVATEAQTGAQGALNAIMALNPIILVVAALALLAGAFILAYKKSETFRNIVGAILDVVGKVAGAIQTGFSAALGYLVQWGPLALAVIFPFLGIPLLIAQHFGAIKGFLVNAFTGGMKAVRDFVGDVVSFVSSIPSKFLGIGEKIGGAMVDAIKNALNDLLHLPLKIPEVRIGAFGKYVTVGGQTLIPRLNAAMRADEISGLMASYAQPSIGLRAASGGVGLGPELSGTLSTQTAAGAGIVIQVNFNGIVGDPPAVAAQLSSLLRGQGIRIGEVATV